MKYVLDCIQERTLNLVLERELVMLALTIEDNGFQKTIYLDEKGIFDLIGALHHIQKQIQNDKK